MEDILNTIVSEINNLKSDLKSINKTLRKIRSHQEDPTGEKTKAKAANNGFNREIPISVEFAKFLEVEPTTKISRSEGTRRVSAYIRNLDLRDPDNGRIILPNDTLRQLLALPDGEQLTFLNIQRYLSKHYIKDEKPPIAPKECFAESSTSSTTKPAKKAPSKRPVVKNVVKV